MARPSPTPRPEPVRSRDARRNGSNLRADPDQVEAVRDVLPATANPEHPNEVRVSRPSDALAARP